MALGRQLSPYTSRFFINITICSLRLLGNFHHNFTIFLISQFFLDSHNENGPVHTCMLTHRNFTMCTSIQYFHHCRIKSTFRILSLSLFSSLSLPSLVISSPLPFAPLQPLFPYLLLYIFSFFCPFSVFLRIRFHAFVRSFKTVWPVNRIWAIIAQFTIHVTAMLSKPTQKHCLST